MSQSAELRVKNFAAGKKVIAYASGIMGAKKETEAAKEKSRFSKLCRKATVLAAGVVLVASLTGCGPSREEINTMKSSISATETMNIEYSMKQNIVSNFDELKKASPNKDDGSLAEKSISSSWEAKKEALKAEGKTAKNSGEYYIAKETKEAVYNSCFEEQSSTIMVPIVISNGKTTSTMIVPQTTYSYTYRPGSMDKVKQEVQQKTNASNIIAAQRANGR
ncbi:MAG: hypothetical protein AB7U85_04515 [Alphaproteobacteria bacterium]